MDDLDSVARELRAAREGLALTREQLAEKVGYTAGYIEKIETGRLPVTEPYLSAALPTLLPGVDVAALFGRLRADDRKRDAVPDWFRPWRDHEQEASEIRCFEPLLAPGLLQTEEYAQALLDDDDRVAARMERQQVLDRAAVTAILAERVLRDSVGGPAVMAEQLELLATTSRAVVQVLPAGADTYLGTLGSFWLATVDGLEVAYSDNPLCGLVRADPGVVLDVRRRWDVLRGEALPRNQSLELIIKVADQWKMQT